MSESLSPTSPRRVFAQRFGRELRKALRTRGVGEKRFVAIAGGSRSTLRQYLAGYNLPRLKTAIAFAESLQWAVLVEICREGRTETCENCGQPFVNEGTPRRFCGEVCLRLAGKKKAGLDSRRRADVAEHRLAEAEELLRTSREAVGAFCRGCEPEGCCRDANCALRPVSPLPFYRASEVPIATPAIGQWGSEEAREKQLAAVRAGNARRWARPGEREKQSERTAAMHAAGVIAPRGKGKAA